jgi:hypothetical protein
LLVSFPLQLNTGGTNTKDNVEAAMGAAPEWCRSMFWRLLIALMKPCAMLALFDVIRRIAEATGLQLNVIDPVAQTISHMTGLPDNYAAIAVIGIVALSLLRILTAVGRVAVSTIPR